MTTDYSIIEELVDRAIRDCTDPDTGHIDWLEVAAHADEQAITIGLDPDSVWNRKLLEETVRRAIRDGITNAKRSRRVTVPWVRKLLTSEQYTLIDPLEFDTHTLRISDNLDVLIGKATAEDWLAWFDGISENRDAVVEAAEVAGQVRTFIVDAMRRFRTNHTRDTLRLIYGA